MSHNSLSKLPAESRALLRAHRFRFRKQYRSGIELWNGSLDLYVQPEEAPRTLSQLLKLCWQVGYIVGQDTERLRISREFNNELDDLILGKEDQP